MPAWPTFSTTPMRSTGRSRPPSRSDAQAMQAMHRWHKMIRDGRPHDRSTRAVAAALDQLADRERQAVDLWLGGAADALIEDRTGIPVPRLGQIRFAVLADVAERLQGSAPARRRSSGDGWLSVDDGDPL